MKVNHYGYVVKDIDNAINVFLKLGYHIERDKYYVDERKQWVSFVTDINNQNRLELLQPADESAPCYKILKKKDIGIYHICYDVEDFDGAMEELRKQGFLPISNITKNYKGLQMVFMYNTEIGMIELFEEA